MEPGPDQTRPEPKKKKKAQRYSISLSLSEQFYITLVFYEKKIFAPPLFQNFFLLYVQYVWYVWMIFMYDMFISFFFLQIYTGQTAVINKINNKRTHFPVYGCPSPLLALTLFFCI